MLEHSSDSEYGSQKHAGALVGAIAGIVVLGGALGGYAIHEHNSAQSLDQQKQALAAENQQASAALDATRQQVSDLAAKLNSLASRPEAEQAQGASPVSSTGSRTAAVRVRRDDPRFKKLQSQLDAQSEAIEQTRNDLTSTQGDLSSARTELTGSIAHTHDELVVLEKRGERSYTEFDLPKSKQFQREGPVEIRVKKADDKHQFADLDMLVDDRNLTQKHVNLYQPVMYSTPDTPQPVEIVINSVTKNHIHGYVSASKYRQSELASMSNATENSDQASGTAGQGANAQGQDQGATDSGQQPSSRRKLPSPM